MPALRTTPPLAPPNLGPQRAWGVFVVALGVFGCGTATPPPDPQSAEVLPAPVVGEDLPPPHADRIEYDAPNRTLNLYDLPGNDRWMVRLPGERHGQAVGPRHRLPEGADTTRTLVYYARPGSRASVAVSVAEIEAGRAGHTSLAFR